MKNKRLYFLGLICIAIFSLNGKIIRTSEPDAFSGPTRKATQYWVNVDLIITDYLTGNPEGHFLYNLVKPAIAGKDMQVKCVQQLSGDFGNTSILYGDNNDTLFAGSIVWMGCGMRTRPAILDTNYTEALQKLKKPAYLQFINADSTSIDKKSMKQAERSWDHISKLQVLSAYQGINFKLAFYLYTPATGKTDLSEAKWIILLERDAGNW
jgi:hypothetical protein